jgi:hypothetical protein
MGATTPYLHLRGRSGQAYTLCLYYAGGDTAGYIVPSQFNGTATANSPKDFTLPEPCIIEYITGPATGQITIDVNGMPTPISINMATVISMVAMPGKNFGQLAGGAQKRYAIRVTGTMAA